MLNTRSLRAPSPGLRLELGGQEAGGDTYRGLGLSSLGLLQSCFAGVQVQTPVLEEPPLLLQGKQWGTVRP